MEMKRWLKSSSMMLKQVITRASLSNSWSFSTSSVSLSLECMKLLNLAILMAVSTERMRARRPMAVGGWKHSMDTWMKKRATNEIGALFTDVISLSQI